MGPPAMARLMSSVAEENNLTPDEVGTPKVEPVKIETIEATYSIELPDWSAEQGGDTTTWFENCECASTRTRSAVCMEYIDGVAIDQASADKCDASASIDDQEQQCPLCPDLNGMEYRFAEITFLKALSE